MPASPADKKACSTYSGATQSWVRWRDAGHRSRASAFALTAREWACREDGLAIAVIVQRMVRARTSGVIFTAEPVTGDRNTLAIDVCPGLGEALVSGQVTPEHFELRRQGFRVPQARQPRRVSEQSRDPQARAACFGD